MDSLIGKTIGSYRILEQIGEGGMATVYKAYQPSLERDVALKILPPQMAKEPGFAKRFRREARSIAQLEHPNILSVHDYGQDNEYSYIVMRYVEGGTLKQLMGKPMNLPQVSTLVNQIAEALEYAHKNGIIHRDVKPSNILMDQEGRILLTDFGLARMFEESQQITATGVGIGTPDYMSPEQGMGEKVDHLTDIYSLGVVLYEMLTGRVPYQAETPMAVVFKHIHDPLPLPRTINPNIPVGVERVVLKAMAKAPEDRYQSAKELARALQDAVKDYDLTLVEVAPVVQLPAQETILETPVDKPQPSRSRKLRYLLWAAIPVSILAITTIALWKQPFMVQIVGGKIVLVKAATPTAYVTGTTNPEHTVTASPTLDIIPTSANLDDGLNIVWFLGFNTSIPPFDNLLVRKAFASAVNKQEVVNYKNQLKPELAYTPATSLTPPNILGVNLYGDLGYLYNPDDARDLLAEAGYPDGEGLPPITLTFTKGQFQEVAELLQEQWREVLGIEITLLPSSMDEISSNPPQLFARGWGADYIDPRNFLYDAICGRLNPDFYDTGTYYQMAQTIQTAPDYSSKQIAMEEYSRNTCDDTWEPPFKWDGLEYQDLLNQALWEESDLRRRKLYIEAERILVEIDVVIIPLWHANQPYPYPEPTETLEPPRLANQDKYIQGEILFQDDFEEGHTYSWSIEGGRWNVVKDQSSEENFVYYTADGEVFLINSEEWKNYAVELKVKFQSLDEGDGFVLKFRRKQQDSCPSYNFAIYKTGPYADMTDQECSSERRFYLLQSSFLTPEEWSTMRVEVFNDNLSMYLNGLLTFSVTDNKLEQGGIALMSWHAPVYIDDVVVYELRANQGSGLSDPPTIVPTPSTTSFGDLIFEEDFEDGIADGFTTDRSIWKVESDGIGNKVLKVGPTASWEYINFGPPVFEDGIIEYRVKFINSSRTFLHFRAMPQGRYVFLANAKVQGVGFYYQGVSDQWIELENGMGRYGFQTDTWYKVRVEFQGDNLRAYIDELLVLQATDTRTKQGTLEFGFYRDTHAYIDDVRVWVFSD